MAPSASGLSRQPLKLESSVRIWQESFNSNYYYKSSGLGKCRGR